MVDVPAAAPEPDGWFGRNLSACEHAQADRGECLHVRYDSQPKIVAVPISPISPLLKGRPKRIGPVDFSPKVNIQAPRLALMDRLKRARTLADAL
jgi:hypothetical protein